MNYTAECLAAKDDGVDFLQTNGMNNVNLIRDCNRQDYHPTYGIGGAASKSTVEPLDGENYAGNLYEFGAFYEGPEVERFRTAVERTDLEDGVWGQTVIHVWLGLEMIGAAMERSTSTTRPGPTSSTPCYSIEDEDLDGQIAPVDYTTQKHGRTSSRTAGRCTPWRTVGSSTWTRTASPSTRLTFICGSKG